MAVFVVHCIIGSRSVRGVSNGIFVFLLFVFVQVGVMLLTADSAFDLFVVLVFSLSLKCVQFPEEELSLSHLHMLSHTCFCPGGLPCWFSPPDIIFWFAAASAPYFDSCGSAVFACGCFPRGWWKHCCPTLQLGVKPFPLPHWAAAVLCWGSFMGAWDKRCTNGIGRIRWQKGLIAASCSGLLLSLASSLQRIYSWL